METETGVMETETRVMQSQAEDQPTRAGREAWANETNHTTGTLISDDFWPPEL